MQMYANAERSLAFHNKAWDGESDPVSYIGGNDIALRNTIWEYLVNAGFNAELAPEYIRGESENNVSNRTLTGSGVQIEMEGVTHQFFPNGDRSRTMRESDEREQFFYDYGDTVRKAIQDHVIRERFGIVNHFPIDEELENYKDEQTLKLEEEIKALTNGKLTVTEKFRPILQAKDHEKGSYSFNLHGTNDSVLFQEWLDSIGFDPADYGRTLSQLRGFVECTFAENNTGTQRITIADWSSTKEYQIYGIFHRATNSTTAWGKWHEEVFVVEEGENVDGKYTRYSDGVQKVECNAPSSTADVAAGALYRSDTFTVMFPMPFVTTDGLTINHYATGISRWSIVAGVPTTTTVDIRHISYIQSTTSISTIVTAEGRWRS
jgi:hypothetical protein